MYCRWSVLTVQLTNLKCQHWQKLNCVREIERERQEQTIACNDHLLLGMNNAALGWFYGV